MSAVRSKIEALQRYQASLPDRPPEDPKPEAAPGEVPVFFSPYQRARSGYLGRKWCEQSWEALGQSLVVLSWTPEDFTFLEEALQSHSHDQTHGRISYDDYLKVGQLMTEATAARLQISEDEVDRGSEKGAPSLRPEYFLLLLRYVGIDGCVPITCLLDFLRRKGMYFQVRSELLTFESEPGYITDHDFYDYMTDLLQDATFTTVQALPEYLPHYATTVMTKLFFDIDPTKRRRVSTKAVMGSDVMCELCEMLVTHEDMYPSSWLSQNKFTAVMSHFETMAEGRDTLTADDFKKMVRFTPFFYDRAFEVWGVSRMHFAQYIEFMVTVDDLGSPRALPFLFKVLDLSGTGKVCPMHIHRFFLEVRKDLYSSLEFSLGGEVDDSQKMEMQAQTQNDAANVTTEVIDLVLMTAGEQRPYLTLGDFEKSAKRRDVFEMLFTLDGYDRYEEQQRQQQQHPPGFDLGPGGLLPFDAFRGADLPASLRPRRVVPQ